jgi:hypothetical protein
LCHLGGVETLADPLNDVRRPRAAEEERGVLHFWRGVAPTVSPASALSLPAAQATQRWIKQGSAA